MVFYHLSILRFEPWCAHAGMPLVCIPLLDSVAGGCTDCQLYTDRSTAVRKNETERATPNLYQRLESIYNLFLYPARLLHRFADDDFVFLMHPFADDDFVFLMLLLITIFVFLVQPPTPLLPISPPPPESRNGLKRMVVELGSRTMSKRQSIISLWIIVR